MARFPHDALCREHDPEIWFPLDEEGGAGEAKAICARCPVREQCLGFALALGIDSGVYGGLTPVERRALRRRDIARRARTV